MAIRMSAKGFTLLEVIIATIIAAVVLLGLGYIVLTTQRHWVGGQRESDLQRDLSLSMVWIKRVLRDGERAWVGEGGASIEVENRKRGWRKRFYREGNNLIMTSGGGAQVIVRNLTGLSFSWGVRDIGIDLTLSEHGRDLRSRSAGTLRNRFLRAEWLFDEGSGTTARDTSAHRNTGTIVGATWIAGQHGSALFFDGTNDCVRVKSDWTLNLTESISIEAAVSLQSIGARQSIVEKAVAEESGYWLGVESDGRVFVELGTRDGFHRVTSTGRINWNEWQAVGFTYNGRHIELYINGQLDRQVVATGAIVSNTLDLFIGARRGTSQWARGRIDGVRIAD
ncbi:MAG: hypothetical protein DDT29_01702 [Dehalococcoidia bacterium]|nr:hypothetical protein [Bacillota bacterium]